jgi:hypothetical protein
MKGEQRVFGQNQSNSNYSGREFPTLNVRSGDSLSLVLERIMEELEANSGERVLNTPSEIYTNVSINSSYEQIKECVNSLSNTNLDYSVSRSNDYYILSWDIRDFFQNLNLNVEVLNIKVFDTLDSANVIYDGSHKSSVIKINRLPFNIDVRARAMTPCGRIEFSATNMVTHKSEIVQKLPLEAQPLGMGSSKMKIDDAIALLTDEIFNLKSELLKKR